MNELDLQLKKLWAGTIENLKVDLLNSSITLKIQVIENGGRSHFEVIFYEISAHYFIRNNGENRLKNIHVEEGDYLE